MNTHAPAGALAHGSELPPVVRLEPSVRGEARIPALYIRGGAALLARPCVAVVGSREASLEGATIAGDIAGGLAALGIVVVSGLAQGIDLAAHRGAMRAPRGRTIAVIGTPLDRAYPKQHAHLQALIGQDHLLVSPFAVGTRTARGHFPARNRVLARLSDVTVLVEAGEKSGTVHLVREALAVGRPVLVAERLVGNVAWVTQLVAEGRVHVWLSVRQAVDACAARAFATETFNRSFCPITAQPLPT